MLNQSLSNSSICRLSRTIRRTVFLPAIVFFASNAVIGHEGVDHALEDQILAAAALAADAVDIDTNAIAQARELSAAVRAAAVNPINNNRDGNWGPLIDWPHIPVSMANLPDGRVLTWASSEIDAFPPGNPEFTHATVWDPASNDFNDVSHTGHDMFCGHNVMLEDGRVFVNGGRNSVRFTSVFDVASNRWLQLPDRMNNGRWYPTSVALADGGVFTAVGSQGGEFPEVWRSNGGWDRLSNVNLNGPILNYSDNAYYERNWWPLLTTTPNGEILHYGPTPRMHRINLNAEGEIRDVGDAIVSWYPKHGASAYYAPGRILHAGGASSGRDLASSDRTFVVDFNNGSQSISRSASMNKRRKFHNAVPLPNGEVLVVGGNTSGTKFSDVGANFDGEIWNPTSNSWRLTAPMAEARTYHSVAVLLPDASVLTGGGGLCGGCQVNHRNAQIYYPPYLYDSTGNFAVRPEITSSPPNIQNGNTFNVTASAGIASFSFAKMSSTTHGVNTDQRVIPAEFVETQSGVYRITADANANVLSPGYYMLFAMNAAGTPSISKTIQIVANVAPNNYAPVLTLGRVENLLIGTSYSIESTVTDIDDDRHSFSARGLPPGMTIDAGTGTISGTPTTFGNYNISVTATDPRGLSDTRTAVWPVGDATGLRYSYYEGEWNNLPNFLALSPVSTGFVNSFKIDVAGRREERFGLRYDGKIKITSAGNYTFYTRSDDGSSLYINGNRIVDNDGLHGSLERSGSTNLTAGYHDIVVEYFEKTGGNVLEVSFAGPAINKQTIPYSALYLEEPISNRDPSISNPGNQQHNLNQAVNLQLTANDPDGDELTLSASGLPDGLTLSSSDRRISGTVTAVGTYNVTVSVADGAGGSASTNFSWEVRQLSSGPLTIDRVIAAPVRVATDATLSANITGGLNPTVRWNFGDGSAVTTPSDRFSTTHTYAQPGRYIVEVLASSDDGQSASTKFIQTVHRPLTSARPNVSMSVIYESRSGGADRLWNVNPDNDSVSVFNVNTNRRLREIAVGKNPRSVARAPDGRIWVSNRLSATISIIDPDSLAVVQTVSLPYGSQPHGLVFEPSALHGWLALAGSSELLRLNPANGAVTRRISIGGELRHVSVDAASQRVFLSKFISPPLPGESTTNPVTFNGSRFFGGEVIAVSTTNFAKTRIDLRVSTRPDAENGGRGIPNYLGPVVLSPDGTQAYVPSKQDNIELGQFRDGQPLDHDNTVRSISSRVSLSTLTEVYESRIDHDDGGVASSATFGPWGTYLYVALEGSRQVAMVEAHTGRQIRRISVGRAPQGLTTSPDGRYLFVHNFMDRSITKLDLNEILYTTGDNLTRRTYDSVGTESLTASVLAGKQLFYDAADSRLASQLYMSCAACHNDGGHDGRVWDLSNLGEGLRNTIDLRGRGGIAHGPLHWSGNFDEVHDFENQIRDLAGGTGLMSNTAFNAGSRSQPLGQRKAGVSADLDRLAAYVSSLTQFPPSAARTAAGEMTAEAITGKSLFESKGCASCHSGTSMTDSRLDVRHDIGTLQSASGNRLGSNLDGLDTPTLRGAGAGAPYLHDGSAESIEAAISRHSGVSVTNTQRQALASFIRQLEDADRDGGNGGSNSVCGPPTINAETDSHLFIWKNCNTNVWQVTSTAGAGNGSTERYAGRISVSDGYSSLTAVSLEASDSLTAVDSSLFGFNVRTSKPWRDDFRFTQSAGAKVCVDVISLPSTGSVVIGATRVAAPIGNAFDPTDLSSCSLDDPGGGSSQLRCGRPDFDSNTERGLFIWQNCTDKKWHILASGSDSASVSDNFVGTVTASDGVNDAVGLSIEDSDTVAVSANTVNFDIRTVKPWVDEFTVNTVDTSPVCISLRQQPASTVVRVGRDRQVAPSNSFDPRTLAACN